MDTLLILKVYLLDLTVCQYLCSSLLPSSPLLALRVDLTTALTVSLALRGLLKSSLGSMLIRRLGSHQKPHKEGQPSLADKAELAFLLSVYAGRSGSHPLGTSCN